LVFNHDAYSLTYITGSTFGTISVSNVSYISYVFLTEINRVRQKSIRLDFLQFS